MPLGSSPWSSRFNSSATALKPAVATSVPYSNPSSPFAYAAASRNRLRHLRRELSHLRQTSHHIHSHLRPCRFINTVEPRLAVQMRQHQRHRLRSVRSPKTCSGAVRSMFCSIAMSPVRTLANHSSPACNSSGPPWPAPNASVSNLSGVVAAAAANACTAAVSSSP